MKKCAWLTDTHLNFVEEKEIINLAHNARRSKSDFALFTGDISEFPYLRNHLQTFQAVARMPVYFVMGNHDYWGSSVFGAQEQAADITRSSGGKINWLPETGPVIVSDDTALVGHDGWYDCEAGDWTLGGIDMNDWSRIEEFYLCMLNLPAIVSTARKIAWKATEQLEQHLRAALDMRDNVIVATHFPVFVESSLYKGGIPKPYSIPFYCNVMMGRMLMEVMGEHPDKTVTVLAGHTHSEARFRPTDNIECFVGSAHYEHPRISHLINVA